MKKIQSLKDIAYIISNNADEGAKETKTYLSLLSRDRLERHALKMTLIVSMMPDFFRIIQEEKQANDTHKGN